MAIKFQLGAVPVEWSIGYRFIVASLLLCAWCAWQKRSLRFSLRDHGFIALQALGLFSANYYMSYSATEYLTTGINAVVFSTILMFNIANSAIFFKEPVNNKVILAALCGIGGLALVFWPEVSNFDLTSFSAMGMVYAISGAAIASLGNIMSVRNQRCGLPVMETNAIGMGYGALYCLAWAMFSGKPMIFDMSPMYIGSLFYLAVVGSIIAFGCYLTLIGRVGAVKGVYPLVMVPVVALLISEIFEDYHWTSYSMIGIAMIIIGNFLVTGAKTVKFTRKRIA